MSPVTRLNSADRNARKLPRLVNSTSTSNPLVIASIAISTPKLCPTITTRSPGFSAKPLTACFTARLNFSRIVSGPSRPPVTKRRHEIKQVCERVEADSRNRHEDRSPCPQPKLLHLDTNVANVRF